MCKCFRYTVKKISPTTTWTTEFCVCTNRPFNSIGRFTFLFLHVSLASFRNSQREDEAEVRQKESLGPDVESLLKETEAGANIFALLYLAVYRSVSWVNIPRSHSVQPARFQGPSKQNQMPSSVMSGVVKFSWKANNVSSITKHGE